MSAATTIDALSPEFCVASLGLCYEPRTAAELQAATGRSCHDMNVQLYRLEKQGLVVRFDPEPGSRRPRWARPTPPTTLESLTLARDDLMARLLETLSGICTNADAAATASASAASSEYSAVSPEHASPEHASPEHASPEHASPEHASPEHASPEQAARAAAVARIVHAQAVKLKGRIDESILFLAGHEASAGSAQVEDAIGV